MVYERVLSTTEAQRHYVKVTASHKTEFPQTPTPFTLINPNGKEITVKLDKQHRIWLPDRFLGQFTPGMVIVIENIGTKYHIHTS